MKIDVYTSTKKPSFSIVVPTGTSLDETTGEVKGAIDRNQPWVVVKSNVELTDIAAGELLAHLEKQLADLGAGAIKTIVTFKEF